ncbi:hypothetical protein HDV05_001886, partial [Chytridiales sp. JEL 0842]
MLYVACRTILTIVTIVLENITDIESRKAWIMTLSCLVCTSVLAFAYVWYIPYYNYNYSVLRAGMTINWFWASLCMVYTVIRPHSDIGIIYMLLVPVAFFVGSMAVHLRRRMIENMRLTAINDPFVLELKVRFKLMEKNLLFRDPMNTNITQFEKSPGDLGTTTTGTNITGKDIAQLDQERAFLDEINDMFVQGARLMPKSCMLQLFMGAFQLIHLGNRAQCLAINGKAATMNPQLDEAFMIYRRQRLLNERFAGGDVIDFIAFEQNLQMARKNEKKATVAVVQFWAELLKRNPSFHRLQMHGAAISSAVSLAQTNYMNLMKLSPEAPHVYRLYGTFLMNVLNDTKQGQDLIDHADEMEEEQREQNDAIEDDEEFEAAQARTSMMDLFSDDNGLITISGELSNLGVITNVNPIAVKIFGFKKNELIGHNIIKIIPSPFAEAHD